MFTLQPFVFELRQTLPHADRRLFRNMMQQPWQWTISEYTSRGSGTCSTKQRLLAATQFLLFVQCFLCYNWKRSNNIQRDSRYNEKCQIVCSAHSSSNLYLCSLHFPDKKSNSLSIDWLYSYCAFVIGIHFVVLTVSPLRITAVGGIKNKALRRMSECKRVEFAGR